ncbi:MAG: sigma-54-dependent Fis family transcriptional regulator, partial [Blastocatellia bacterium]|nr:sigma-54-dependent Fis family transcriptional regulator [Blastocatellia bacterium]
RVLEEGKFRRVGGLKDLNLNVRVIAASNRDLKTEIEENKFRLDLYYRLSVIQIDIAPLRERENDVLLLAKYYINIFNERLRKNINGLSSEVEKIFLSYKWPGNGRELRNCIERAMILEDGNIITTKYLPRGLMPEVSHLHENVTSHITNSPHLFHLPPTGISLEEVELSLVQQAMDYSNNNQTRAAELLGISRDQLRYRLKKLEGIDAEGK